ncbi:Gfo/Idh/MocA family oxidoreductase [Salicibibacter cibarius]|uniref:Gfo/Idh/MocA family oxidoreductase n=1 Tax=Salicibibacter cibarius TaxID=2743000 RepID=A0A7T7CC86_9BACI|nr:Gfo/Idh/MocA family oxidoreductase [Salicibibacter cibarius]QQK76655.1 Gfo/Idh/MocA family oxidoreductase [Salicibibacter cibarius]
MDKVNAGIIGLGRFGRLHLKVLEELPNCEVVAVAEKDQNTLDRVKEDHDIAKAFTDAEHVINDPEIDSIHVITDENSHGEFVKKILKKSKHVFVEKPLATSYGDGKEIGELATSMNKIVMVGNINRFSQPYISIKNNVRNNHLGEIATIRVKRDFSKKWFENFGKRIHPVYESGIHDIDLLLWYVKSKCERVFAVEKYTSRQRYPDLFSAILTFENGVVASLESAWLLPEGGPKNLVENLELDGTINGQIEVIGEKGTANFDLLNPGYSIWTEEKTLYPELTLWPYDNEKVSGAIRSEIEHYINQVLSGVESSVSPLPDSIDALKISEAIQKSAETKMPISL